MLYELLSLCRVCLLKNRNPWKQQKWSTIFETPQPRWCNTWACPSPDPSDFVWLRVSHLTLHYARRLLCDLETGTKTDLVEKTPFRIWCHFHPVDHWFGCCIEQDLRKTRSWDMSRVWLHIKVLSNPEDLWWIFGTNSRHQPRYRKTLLAGKPISRTTDIPTWNK